MAPPFKKSQAKKKAGDAPKFNKSSKKSFKPNKDQNDDARSEAVALQLEADVPDFPREGGSSLNRQVRDEIQAEVDAEFEAEERELKKRKKKGMQKKSVVTEDDLGRFSVMAFPETYLNMQTRSL